MTKEEVLKLYGFARMPNVAAYALCITGRIGFSDLEVKELESAEELEVLIKVKLETFAEGVVPRYFGGATPVLHPPGTAILGGICRSSTKKEAKHD